MTKKALIESLGDLATFVALAAKDSGEEKTKEIDKGGVSILYNLAFWEGKEEAYKTAFNKLDAIIKEAKDSKINEQRPAKKELKGETFIHRMRWPRRQWPS